MTPLGPTGKRCCPESTRIEKRVPDATEGGTVKGQTWRFTLSNNDAGAQETYIDGESRRSDVALGIDQARIGRDCCFQTHYMRARKKRNTP